MSEQHPAGQQPEQPRSPYAPPVHPPQSQQPYPQPYPGQQAPQPQYPAPGYGDPQGYQPRPPSGALAWGLGFLVFVPIPFFSVLIAGIAMIATGLSLRRAGGIAGANGRNAANWGVTIIALTVLLVGGHFILLYMVTKDGPVSGFFPLGIPITIWLLVMVAHVVLIIVGLVKAKGGREFTAPAIPFFAP